MSRGVDSGRSGSRAAVFLDKDGTLVADLGYEGRAERMALLPGVAAGLRELGGAGYLLVVASNQSGVARGCFPARSLDRMRARLDVLFAGAGVELAGCYWCPHHPDGEHPLYGRACTCRKPEPGLLYRAAAELDLDLRRSWMVGNRPSDAAAGRRAGCRTVLVGGAHDACGARADDFAAAVAIILAAA